MNTIIVDRCFDKKDKSTQKVILRGITKLQNRYEYYREAECIFNDDILVHDIIEKKYFVYKCCVGKVQLRILYFLDNETLIIISTYIKKKATKEYIAFFERAAHDYEILQKR